MTNHCVISGEFLFAYAAFKLTFFMLDRITILVVASTTMEVVATVLELSITDVTHI